MDTSARIYSELELRATPLPAPGGWSDSQPLLGYHQPLLKGPRLLEILCRTFRVDELLGAGVCLPDDEQPRAVRLHPDLAGPEKRWLALRTAPDAEPYDVVVNSGCLSGRLPALAVLDEFRVLDLLRTTESPMLVAFAVADMATLLAAEFPATTASGLDTLGGTPLAQFCQAYGHTPHLHRHAEEITAAEKGPAASAHATSAGEPPAVQDGQYPHIVEAGAPRFADRSDYSPKSLGLEFNVPPTLVAWSPARRSLACPSGHVAVASHLRLLSQYLGISTNCIQSWQPSPPRLDQLEFASQFGSSEQVQQILDTSLQRDLLPTFKDDNQVLPSGGLAGALTAWLAASSDMALQSHTWRSLQTQLEEQIYKPLLDRADRSNDPAERSQLVGLIALSKLMHDSLLQQIQRAQIPRVQTAENTRLSLDYFKYIINLTSILAVIGFDDFPACSLPGTWSYTSLPGSLQRWKRQLRRSNLDPGRCQHRGPVVCLGCWYGE